MKIGFVSLGCPKNLVDTEVMMGHLAARGHELTPQAGEADVIVVNTCSFIDPAKQESIDTIIEMGRYKQTGKARRLVVAGCMVERYRDQIAAQLPEVDALVGTNEVERIVAACEGDAPGPAAGPYLYHDTTPRVFTTPRHFAYLKIAEGCDHPCTFCVIPQFRGAFRSRRFESVVVEANRMLQQGVREINLIGQDTTCYGEDLGIRDGLAALLDRLAQIEDAPAPYWIRFLYAYPNRVSQKLLDTIAAHPALVKYIDMPLQHAAPGVLKRMKRGSNGDQFLRILERVRKTIPGVAIRSSFIVGFPGESDADFDYLCQFVTEAKFDRLGVFTYSDEDSSASHALDGKVGGRVMHNRKRRLMAVQRRISRRLQRGHIGREYPVLVEGPSRETDLLWEARLPTQAPDIDGVCYINDDGGHPLRPGEMRRIRITESHDYDLVGEIVDQPEAAWQRPAPPLFPILPARPASGISRGQ